jgi:DUF971 family protein
MFISYSFHMPYVKQIVTKIIPICDLTIKDYKPFDNYEFNRKYEKQYENNIFAHLEFIENEASHKQRIWTDYKNYLKGCHEKRKQKFRFEIVTL